MPKDFCLCQKRALFEFLALKLFKKDQQYKFFTIPSGYLNPYQFKTTELKKKENSYLFGINNGIKNDLSWIAVGLSGAQVRVGHSQSLLYQPVDKR